MLAKHALSQLSYGPFVGTGVAGRTLPGDGRMVGPVRFELTTPRLSSVCSDQLSYEPHGLTEPKLCSRSRKGCEDGAETVMLRLILELSCERRALGYP